MTAIPPLSPIQLREHRFTELRLKAVENGTDKGLPSITTTIWYDPDPKTPNQWILVLLVQLSSDPSKPFWYDAEIRIQGLIAAADTLNQDVKEQLALTNGFSVLYGAVRELLLNLTARSVYGPVPLPTLSFVELVKDARAKKAAPAVPASPVPSAESAPSSAEKN